MPSYQRLFRCEVITPAGRAYAGELVSAVFPAPDGLVGVLGGRGPLVTLLGSGPLTVRPASGNAEQYYVSGGFARFHENTLTLLPEQCMAVRDIDPEQAWEEINAAQQMPRETPEERAARDEALQAARSKFSLAQEYRTEADDI